MRANIFRFNKEKTHGKEKNPQEAGVDVSALFRKAQSHKRALRLGGT